MLTMRFSSLLALPGTITAAILGLSLAPQPGCATPGQDIDLQVGIVQRFGRQPSDVLMLQAQPGDRLTIRFQTGDKAQAWSGATAQLAIVQQALPTPQIEERVVLATHRSYESAEDEANRWRAEGIPVEIAQPKRWQVWAKRDVYHTPLLRRLLLQSLQRRGIQTAFVDTQVLQKRPQVVLEVNGRRVAQDQLQIASGKGIIKVVSQRTDDPPKPNTPPERTERLYSGNLRLQRNAYGTYTLVNQVPLETYLRGVVPHEIGSTTTPSVLETQAILARTYALRNLRRFAIDDYQLCADTQCQVYYGLTGITLATDRAIAATRGKVLTYQNELVDAVYSAATGGVTAAFNDVWHGPSRPYLRPIIDSVAAKWDLSQQSLANEQNFRQFVQQKQGFNEDDQKWFRWRYDSSLSELNQELREYLKSLKSPLANFKTIQGMEVLQRSPAGRVQILRVTTDQGAVDLEKDNILIAFYAPASLLFYMDPLYDAQKKLTGYAFIGGGLGHGVGLSQSGSYRLGKLGWNSDRILSFYYPGTQVQSVNNSLVFWRDPANLQPPEPQM
ncbi:MAG: SpoIID/LytB domain-containing protein [Leptodesmis sp.]|uniref:SpoIID/LytB domain-containing protein n=1 Tax=Leptodesmis sp. TaxID=3100501 RepID=UPI003D11736E